MSRRTSVIAVAALVALALTGCGGIDQGQQPIDPADSPLSKYLSAIYGQSGDEDDREKEAIEQSKKTEELVAQCMSDEGFEYTPQTQNISFQSGTEWNPDDKERAAQYGYGLVNYPGHDEVYDSSEMPEDPNQDYIASLSESEQTAYYEVLYGPPPTEEEIGEGGSYESTWEQQGCYGWASHEVQGDDPMQLDEHKPLMDALNAFWQEQSTGPELAKIDAEWASCMADAGYSGFTNQSDAQTSVQDELNEYYEAQTEDVENDPKLAKIEEKEIELALVDLNCRESTDYHAKAQKISFALEERFISDHKAELDALKAAAEQGRK